MSGVAASFDQATGVLKLLCETKWTKAEMQRRFFARWGLLRDIAVALDDPQLTEDQVRAMHPLFYRKGEVAELPTEMTVGGVTYDQSIGLAKIIERAVGRENLGNVNRDITQERFPLKGTGVRKVLCRVEAYLDGETSEEAAKRLLEAGHTLGNTGDLAGFLHDHPEEVAKWNWVDAISEDSRWTDPDGSVLVPYACVGGAYRYFFRLNDFRLQHNSSDGVLVLCE
ncbi:hypothetical protein KKD80_03875 [Patescibacteria group bacterium]|nr:hypothetical protein [Patescibacteria group bacterium]